MKNFKYILFSFLIIFSTLGFGQQQTLKGFIINEQTEPVMYATAALLEPADSTLAFFGFSKENGSFEIKNVKPGKYILQISFIGYRTYDTILSVPRLAGDDLGIFVMQVQVNELDAVNISGERTPLQIKGDTIEYNAGSFKTTPDASVEDLLKKLPGVEVDQAGNIKAQGEDVQQVLVDGKEFFSNDPTVATKNLPADAIDKVQVYDKSSEDAEFTGIEDGSRSKTINLLLKDDRKSMWLGDITAGYGTEDTYKANAKLYRFTKTDQIAVLGMFNNINDYGFSINDYIDFNGGMGAMMSGGGFRIGSGDGDNIPINFGGSVDGLITSGAAGANYTHEVTPGNRINFSYLGNGSRKDLIENTFTQNFLPDLDYNTEEYLNELTDNFAHRLNFNVRNKPDSMQNIIATGGATISYGDQGGNYFINNFISDSLTNALTSETYENSNSIKGNINLNYVHKLNGKWRYVKTMATGSGKSTLSETQWNNLTQYFGAGTTALDNSYQNNKNQLFDYSLTQNALYKIKDGYYLEPSVTLGGINELLNREQASLIGDELPVDSLSPEFTRNNYWVKPGIGYKFSSQKKNWKITLAAEYLSMQNVLNGTSETATDYIYILPSFNYDKEIKEGRHIRLFYESYLNTPTATQLMPVTDYINSLSLYSGNINLKPEYSHMVSLHYMLFDQFSFTSFFTNLYLTYTKDKINYAKIINADLSESLTLINTPSDFNAGISADFSTPIRPLKINSHISLSENYDRGINYINDIENSINAFTHGAEISFDNRKKAKLDVSIGASIAYTQAKYSIQTTQSGNYINSSLFAEGDYSPTDKWRFSFDANVERYATEGDDDIITLPILKAEITRYILKGNRGTINLKGYDLLDKNSGITQTSAYNFIQVKESNTIGRYVMLSFKYRINKTEVENGVEIKMKH